MNKPQVQSIVHAFDADRVRAEFPILAESVNDHPLVYLDNAATTQKPRSVIETIDTYYRRQNANIHRGVHTLSQRGTDAYESARARVGAFINAGSSEEIVFTRGTTESINLVAQTLGRKLLHDGGEVLILESEHHSNIVPWQMLCEQVGARLVVAPINDAGEVIVEEFAARVSPNTKIVSVGHISNALGTINPVRELTRIAHAAGAIVILDGAQAVAHTRVDVTELGCDFYAFSGHKLFAPTGIGVLYGKRALLEEMPPYQGGGDMIKEVRFDRTEYNDVPYKFEAGTPHIAGAIGLGAAIDFLAAMDFDAAVAHEDALLRYATDAVLSVGDVRIIGTAAEKTAVLSFVVEGIHPQDIGLLLDHQGVAVRTGHHCAMPVMQRFGLPGTVRASLSFYNTRDDIDRFIAALKQAKTMLM